MGTLRTILEMNNNLAIYDMQMKVMQDRANELTKRVYQDPRHLLPYGYKVYSQSDEDGIIQEIFNRIGAATQTFIEFGVETGVECNTVKLLVEGWNGLWIEGNPQFVGVIKTRMEPFIASEKLKVLHSFITAENINDLFKQTRMPSEIDFLSIDIDNNDYWVWKAIDTISPRVVCIEYNAILRPPMSLVIPYNPTKQWDNCSNYYGASLNALAHLGLKKGYYLVGCNYSGSNAFFVRQDLVEDKFIPSSCAEDHYQPPRHWAMFMPNGHVPNPGFYETVGE